MCTNELVEKITDTVIDTIIEKGIDFTVQDIANELHISKKTVYTLFASKEELCLAAVSKIYEDIIEYKKQFYNSNLDLLEKIRCILIYLPDRYKMFNFRGIYNIVKEYPSLHDVSIDFDKRCWGRLNEIVAEGRDQGIIREFSMVAFKKMVSSGLYSLMNDRFAMSESESDEIVEEMSRLFIQSIITK